MQRADVSGNQANSIQKLLSQHLRVCSSCVAYTIANPVWGFVRSFVRAFVRSSVHLVTPSLTRSLIKLDSLDCAICIKTHDVLQ